MYCVNNSVGANRIRTMLIWYYYNILLLLLMLNLYNYLDIYVIKLNKTCLRVSYNNKRTIKIQQKCF